MLFELEEKIMVPKVCADFLDWKVCSNPTRRIRRKSRKRKAERTSRTR